jgi:hypothetical protein
VSSSLDDGSPHVFFILARLRLLKFVSSDAKRLFRQYRTTADMDDPPEIDANDAYRLLMDRQRFRSRWNFCIARKRKLKGGPTPVCTETLFELMT